MLKKIVSAELEAMLSSALFIGYAEAQKIKNLHEIFDCIIGSEAYPYLRRLAIEFYANRKANAIKNLSSKICPNKSGNYHHVELCYNENLIITFNHLANINGVKQTMPRHAIFREQLARNNSKQIEMFPTYPEKYFAEGQILATLVHEGRNYPERAELQVHDSKFKKVIDRLSISTTKNVDLSDMNIVEGTTPEFIQFAKEAYQGLKK